MSAYALPGVVFRDDGRLTTTNTRPMHDPQQQHNKELWTMSKGSLDSVMTEKPNNDLPKEVGIAVKEARLDPIRLVQVLSKESGDDNDDSEDAAMPRTSRPKKTTTTTCQSKQRSSLHEDAIQFELSISFNGRTYAATRTLPRIVKLRNDLIRELQARRRNLQRLPRRWRRRQGNITVDESDKVKSLDDARNNSSDDDTAVTVSSQVDDTSSLIDEEDWEKLIPEVPECDAATEATAGGSFAGRGFTMLHRLLRSYCPAMESWLQNIAELVPPCSSPSLTNFLWEPLAIEGGERFGRIPTVSSLDYILENGDEDNEEKPGEDRVACE